MAISDIFNKITLDGNLCGQPMEPPYLTCPGWNSSPPDPITQGVVVTLVLGSIAVVTYSAFKGEIKDFLRGVYHRLFK